MSNLGRELKGVETKLTSKWHFFQFPPISINITALFGSLKAFKYPKKMLEVCNGPVIGCDRWNDKNAKINVKT